jgi:hypothetical protein
MRSRRRAVLGVAAPAPVVELVVGDAEQPAGRRAALGPIARATDQGGGERLRRQVGGGLGVVRRPHQVARHPPRVATVELGERVGPVVGQQLGVGHLLREFARTTRL